MNFFFEGTFCFDRDFSGVRNRSNGVSLSQIALNETVEAPTLKKTHDSCYQRRTLKPMTIRTFRDPHSRKGKTAARKLQLRLAIV